MNGSATMFSCFRSLLGAASILAGLAMPAFAEGETNMLRFDRTTVGSPPPGFTFAKTGKGSDGEWMVVADPTAKEGFAIEQTSTDTTDYRFPLAIHASLSAKNLKA